MYPRFNRKQKFYGYVFALLVLFSSIYVAVMRCAMLIQKNYLEQLEQNLVDVSKQNAQSLKDQVYLRYKLLESVAMRFNMEPDKRNENLSLFVPVTEAFNIKRIGYCDANGVSHATSGVETNLCYRDFFKKSINGQVYISEVLKDVMDENHEDITVISMPIYDKNNRINGVAGLTYRTETLSEEMNLSTFEGYGSSFVFTPAGNISLSSNKEIMNLYDNIYDVLWGEMGAKFQNRNQMLNHILKEEENGENNLGTLTLRGNEYYYYITPVSLLDGSMEWSLLSLIPVSFLQQRFADSKRNLNRMLICILLSGLFSILIVQMVSMKQNKAASKLAYTSLITNGPNKSNLCYELDSRVVPRGFMVYMSIENFRLISLAIGQKKSERLIMKTWQILKKAQKKRDYFCHDREDSFVLFMDEFFEEGLIIRILDLQEKIQKMANTEHVSFFVAKFGICKVKMGQKAEESSRKAEITVQEILNSDEDFSFFDEEKQQRLLSNQELENYFEEALEKREFKIFMQPKYSAKGKTLTGAEALVRWDYKGNGIIPPDSFIPLLERSGKITKLDEYIFRRVCEFQSSWQKKGLKTVPVSVNISKASLLRNQIVDLYLDILSEYGLTPETIQLEVTETQASTSRFIAELLNTFREKGIKILMDDFGTGYTSLSTLNLRCFDTLKMDKSLIDGIENDYGRDLLESLFDMTHHLGYYITAEGVEKEDQLHFLKAIRCDDIQGFLFSKPKPAEAFEKEDLSA